MVYTVTFNPALDYVVHTDKLDIGMTNRAISEQLYFGGKGINVSFVLRELGVENVALGFVAGFTGEALERELSNRGIDTDFVYLHDGFTRINVKIKSEFETEINGCGPNIDDESIQKLYAKLDALCDGDILVLAGSIPKSLPENMYEEILERLSDKKIKTVVDATGDLLKNVLKYKPFLIKPNNFELSELFGRELLTHEEIIECAAQLQREGAQNVLVSMAGDGAILLDAEGKTHFCPAAKGKVKNSVGAGDSMVAGFIAGCVNGDYEYALNLGTAAGGATAFSDGLADRKKIFELME